jgi:hypothetical protein
VPKRKRRKVMTNQEIEKYKKELATITKEINIAKNEPLGQRLKKLQEAVKKIQKLADDVSTYKYYQGQLPDDNDLGSCSICEKIYKEIYHDIHCTLQTEEMFNACVSAKRSCRWAALAAIVACISVILTVCLN